MDSKIQPAKGGSDNAQPLEETSRKSIHWDEGANICLAPIYQGSISWLCYIRGCTRASRRSQEFFFQLVTFEAHI